MAGGTNTGGGGGGGAAGNTTPIANGSGGAGGPGRVLIQIPAPQASGKTFSIAPGTNTITTQPPGTKVASFTVNGTLTVD